MSNLRCILTTFCLLVTTFEPLVAIETTDPNVIRLIPPPFWPLANAKESELTFTFFRNASDKTGMNLTRQNVREAPINKNLKSIMITHGFIANVEDPWFPEIRDNFFKIGQYNIIFLDWRVPANRLIFVAFANVKSVSEFVVQFLLESGIQPEKMHLIGHSLGGQLMGYIAKLWRKYTKRQVDRITGLDPAAPGFEYPVLMTNKDRLYRTDARFVDVIHTNIKLYGYVEPIGHVDFYPNYGEHQPGCPKNASGNLHCSHARAPYYFAESITVEVKAVTCTLKREPLGTKYDVTVVPDMNGAIVTFGQHVNQTARGTYFLRTNPDQPYLTKDSI